MEALRIFARNNPLIVFLYKIFKKALVAPFYLTPLKTIQLDKVPFLQLFNIKKMSILTVAAPYTKAGYPRLTNVYDLAVDIEEKKIPGAFVECGTWKGGCAAIMAAVAHRYGDTRTTWYFDSYEGMPEPTPEDGTKEETDHMLGDYLRASVADVEDIVFHTFNLPRDKNVIVKGWFNDTLPTRKNDVGPIAILRLDADWYEPTILILRELYDQVVSGGYVIFDDYGRWQGCKKATEDFIAERGLKIERQFIGKTGTRPMYFRKP